MGLGELRIGLTKRIKGREAIKAVAPSFPPYPLSIQRGYFVLRRWIST